MNFKLILESLIDENGRPFPAQLAADKRKTNVRDEFKKTNTKYKIGDRVIGIRKDDKNTDMAGELVKQDVTINPSNYNDERKYRNPCYHIKCDKDGKVRKFQGLKKESN